MKRKFKNRFHYSSHSGDKLSAFIKNVTWFAKLHLYTIHWCKTRKYLGGRFTSGPQAEVRHGRGEASAGGAAPSCQ